MKNENDNPILKQAIETFGEDAQIDQAIEEMAELTQALIKRRRYKNDVDTMFNVAEEMADVLIMMEQLFMIFNNDKAVLQFQEDKLIRLKERLDKTTG